MIDQRTGAINLTNSHVEIEPGGLAPEIESGIEYRLLKRTPWSRAILGILSDASEGDFETELVLDPDDRIRLVLFSHEHSFYRNVSEDSERRAYHDGLINRQLGGKTQFSWGHIVNHLDSTENRDWLIVVYAPASGIDDPIGTDGLLSLRNASK